VSGGQKAIGGCYSETAGNSILVRYTGPTTTAAYDSWTITAEQILSFTGTYTVMAICVSAL
jgi:hypothetical protein